MTGLVMTVAGVVRRTRFAPPGQRPPAPRRAVHWERSHDMTHKAPLPHDTAGGRIILWSRRRDLNPQPADYKSVGSSFFELLQIIRSNFFNELDFR